MSAAPAASDAAAAAVNSARQWRHDFAPRFCAETPSNFAKIDPGHYTVYSEKSDTHHRIVSVREDGTVEVAPRAYVDDVVAFCYGAIRSNHTIGDDIKAHLARFLDAMDARAVARHGYAGSSDAERTYAWTPLAPPA